MCECIIIIIIIIIVTGAQRFPQAASTVLYPGQVAMLSSVCGCMAEGLLPGSIAKG